MAEMYVIPDFFQSLLPNELMRLVLYLLIFGILAIVQAGTLKRKLLIESPRNRFNWVFFGIIGIAIWRMEYFLNRDLGLTAFTVIFYVLIEYLAHRIIPGTFYILHIYDIDNCNVIRDEYIMYKHGAILCVALQDLYSTILRILFNRHVYVKTNSGTTFTENFDTPLFLCNSYTIKEETVIEETPETGIRSRLFKWFSPRQIVMTLDVCQAHEYNRYEFVRKVTVLDYLVQKYEVVIMNYVKLRTIVTSLVARKQASVLMSALKVFEDSIQITKEERTMLRTTMTKSEEELKKIDIKQKMGKGEKVVQSEI